MSIRTIFLMSSAVLLAACSRNGESVRGTEENGRGLFQRNLPVVREDDHPHHGIDAKRKDELAHVLAEVVLACSNQEVAIIQDWARRLPAEVAFLRESDFMEICQPLSAFVCDTMLKYGNGKALQMPHRVEDLEHEIRMSFAIVRLWGACCLRRKSYGAGFDGIEAAIYRGLKDGKKFHHDQGRLDEEKAINEHMDEWVRQIESPAGFTRAVAEANVEHHKMWGWKLMKEHSMSWDEILERAVNVPAKPLIDAGYTPEWVQELKMTSEPKWSPNFERNGRVGESGSDSERDANEKYTHWAERNIYGLIWLDGNLVLWPW